MAIHKLTAAAVEKKKAPGRYGDGGGLWLHVAKSGTKSWVFRYMIDGRSREMGLGALHTVSLKKARLKAQACRELLDDDVDPLEDRERRRAATRQSKTFADCTRAYLDAHGDKWRNEKHRWQWENTLARFAFPVVGNMPVSDITVQHIVKILEPIWKTKNETAVRTRGRVEAVIAWARVMGFCEGDNPAKWTNNLDKLLPAPSEVRKVQHLASMPHAQVPEFVAKLRQQPGIAARALEFTILTAARTNETIGATWSEIDLDAATWTVPADRMKAGKDHVVPLSDRAVEILREMEGVRSSDWVFPGWKKGNPLSNMAMLTVIKKAMAMRGVTVHGFRSSFRDWVADATDFPREVAEHSLAHQLPDKVEAAYQRSTMFDKRRELLTAWADFTGGSINE